MSDLPFIYQFFSGAVAGISEIACMYPLDVVKTRMQLQTAESVEKYNSMFDAFRKIIRKEGASKLYRGISAPLVMEAPKRAVKFSANDSWGKFYRQFFGVQQLTQPMAVLTGATAGATESLVVVPFELVKIRLQNKNSIYKGPIDVVSKMIRQEGLLSLYNGLEATMWRHIMWNGGFFGCISKIRSMMPTPKSESQKVRNDLISGSIGGTIGTFLNTPFDVVKSRVQNYVHVPGKIPKYNWTFPALGTIVREEGFTALYKGFIPKVLRLGPGGGILLVVYTKCMEQCRKYHNS